MCSFVLSQSLQRVLFSRAFFVSIMGGLSDSQIATPFPTERTRKSSIFNRNGEKGNQIHAHTLAHGGYELDYFKH